MYVYLAEDTLMLKTVLSICIGVIACRNVFDSKAGARIACRGDLFGKGLEVPCLYTSFMRKQKTVCEATEEETPKALGAGK